MHNYIDVLLCDDAVTHGEGYSVPKEFLSNGWIEAFNIKDSKCVLVLAWYVFEPFDDGQGAFPLVYHGMSLYSGVNFVKNLLATTSYVTLCGVDKSVGGLILEIVFVVF